MNKYSDIELKDSWCIYNNVKSEKNNYEQNTDLIASCSTVFQFWLCYDTVPKPSQFFYQKDTGKPYYLKNDNKREISSISVFKKGIVPKWEDPMNKNGGTLDYRLRQDINIDVIDKMWLHLCTNCLCNQIHDCVNGFRLVDSSVIAQNKSLYRIELWFSDYSKSQEVEKKFRQLFNLEHEQKIIIKKHIV